MNLTLNENNSENEIQITTQNKVYENVEKLEASLPQKESSTSIEDVTQFSMEGAKVEGKSTSLDKESSTEPQLSKSALKRKRKRELWEQQKKERRIKEKERKKQKRLTNPTSSTLSVTRKQLKDCTMAKSNCQVTVVIDLSLEKYMDERSLGKCMKQICRCYSINRRAANPVQFHVTSLEGKSLAEMSKNSGYSNWDVKFHDKNYLDIFSKEKIVYLTSESDNVIETIEDDKVYIIGGLVDHNSHKGLSHRLAQEKGLQHGRLPIGENIDLKTRKVLTIDHVFNIMVNICNGQTWKDALLQVLPARKGAQEKSKKLKWNIFTRVSVEVNQIIKSLLGTKKTSEAMRNAKQVRRFEVVKISSVGSVSPHLLPPAGYPSNSSASLNFFFESASSESWSNDIVEKVHHSNCW
nr:EOG090X0D3U [Megafenestra aurita]